MIPRLSGGRDREKNCTGREQVMWQQVAVILEEHGIWGLLILAFAESSFFPLAPDFLLIPLSLARPEKALIFALLCTLASVAGARFGYFLGQTIGHPLLRRLASRAMLQRVEDAFDRYGGWAVLIAALIPLPYKIFTIASGCFSLSVPRFLLAALVGRGVRFFLEAALVIIMGEQAVVFIRDNLSGLTVFLAAGIVGFYLLLKYRGVLQSLVRLNIGEQWGRIKAYWSK